MDELTQFVCESWSLFAAAVLFTLMRLFARVRQIGFNGLQVDDYLAFIALVSRWDFSYIFLGRCTD
jgi:hypothetical protein